MNDTTLTTIPCDNPYCDRGWIETDGDWYSCPTCDRTMEIEIQICTTCRREYDNPDCSCDEKAEEKAA